MSRNNRKSPWINSENALFLRICEQHGNQWKNVARDFNLVTRSGHQYDNNQCYTRHRTLSASISKKRWSRAEDKLLHKVVQMLPPGNNNSWSRIADFIPGRDSKQCRERWLDYVDPNIDLSPMRDAEITIILHCRLQRMGWAHIRDELPPVDGKHRSANKLKNFWSTLKSSIRESGQTRRRSSSDDSVSYDVEWIPSIVSHFRQRQTFSPVREEGHELFRTRRGESIDSQDNTPSLLSTPSSRSYRYRSPLTPSSTCSDEITTINSEDSLDYRCETPTNFFEAPTPTDLNVCYPPVASPVLVHPAVHYASPTSNIQVIDPGHSFALSIDGFSPFLDETTEEFENSTLEDSTLYRIMEETNIHLHDTP